MDFKALIIMQICLSKKRSYIKQNLYRMADEGTGYQVKCAVKSVLLKKLQVVSACGKEHRTIWVNINVFKRKPDTGILESKLLCCKRGNFYVHLLNQRLKKENKTTNTWEAPNYFKCNS